MKRVLAVLIVVAVLLGMWLSGIARRSAPDAIGSQSAGSHDSHEEADAPIATVNGADVQRSNLGSPTSATSAAGAVLPDTVTIRSSIGLELPFAEIEHEANEWTQVDLDHGSCARSALAGASSVRAPGHVAVAFASDAKEIVLEPDALLVLHADGLRACVRTIDPRDPDVGNDPNDLPIVRSEMLTTCAWGWLSKDEWAVALAPARLAEFHRQRVVFVLHWRDERTVWIGFAGRASSRERWELPCEQRVTGAPLILHVKRLADEPRGPLVVYLLREKSSGSRGFHFDFSWGTADFSAEDEFLARRRLEDGASDIAFPFAPTGVQLLASALDDQSKAYDRIEFFNDARDRELILRPAFRLRGRFVADSPGPSIAHVDVSCHFSEGGQDVLGWIIAARALVPSPDGAFEVRGPFNILPLSDEPLDAPSTVRMQLESPGFERAERTFETHGGSVVECGDIVLHRRPAEIVLAPGHGLLLNSVQWNEVTTVGDPPLFWVIRDARLLDDGALEIVLRRDEERPELLEVTPGDRMAWPDPPPDRCLIHVHLDNRDESRGYERDEGGRYKAAPVLERDIDFDCRNLPADQEWLIGWAWKGLFTVCSSSESKKIVHARMRAPAEESLLYWSKDGMPPREGDEGGSMPFDSVHAPIVLR